MLVQVEELIASMIKVVPEELREKLQGFMQQGGEGERKEKIAEEVAVGEAAISSRRGSADRKRSRRGEQLKTDV